MTTLIAVYSSDGCVGRCDAKCYDAEYPVCECICGGKNHGAGIRQALENTRELAEGWIERHAREYEPEAGAFHYKVPAMKPQQLTLL